MSDNKTNYFAVVVSSLSAAEFPLLLITINHSTLAAPIRLVNDTQDITSNANVYLKSSFKLAPPNDPEQGLPSSTLTLANTGDKVIPDFLETIQGQSVSVTIQIILRSSPDTVEYSSTLNATSFTITASTIAAKLQPENYFRRAWSSFLYDSKNSPSLI